MLCPEVWNFEPPPSSASSKFCKSEDDIFQAIKLHYLNHHVSITIPNTIQLPKDLVSAALDDSQFYRINEVPAVELVKKEFLDLFISKGRLTTLSLNEIPEENSCVIVPCGKLILSLSKTTFQKLGIESTLRTYYKTSVRKYFVILDLNSDSQPIIKKCEQVRKKLSVNSGLCFDIILAWEPEDPNICPSTIAYYFSKKGYFVKTCDVHYKHKLQYNVAVPLVDEESDPSELIEWLGAHNLECDMSNDNYFSSMKTPEWSEMFGQVMNLSFTGLISHDRLKNIICELRNYMKVQSSLVWSSMSVQGFNNHILSFRNKQLCVSNGDHHTTVFLRQNQPSLIYTFQDKKS